MTVVDWLIVVLIALLALQGYSRGFIVGVLSLAGFAAGALIGSRFAPLLLPGGSHSRYAPLFGLAGALLGGAVLATGLEGLGRTARGVFRIPGFRLADGLAGAILTGCLGLGIAWIAGAVALQSSGSQALRRDIQRSAILSELNAVLPPSGPILNALARFDPLPGVAGSTSGVSRPDQAIIVAAGVREAAPSVVRVLGTACGLGIEGSGWVARHDLVVTNAHVVAGETDTTVQVTGTGPHLPAKTIVFDVHNDIAILQVRGLRARPLSVVARPRAGSSAAILGYPEDGSFDAQPGRIGAAELRSTENAYGNGPVEREITPLRGLVRPGNSGGPLIDERGRTLATVFAALTNAPPGQAGGFAIPNSVVERDLARARHPRHRGGSGSGVCAQ